MYDVELTLGIIHDLQSSARTIRSRIMLRESPEDFLGDDEGLMILDSICMQLVALGEGLKNLDKITGRNLLAQYPDIPWKRVMGTRDVLSHNYFHMDAELIYALSQNEVPLVAQGLNTLAELLGRSSEILPPED